MQLKQETVTLDLLDAGRPGPSPALYTGRQVLPNSVVLEIHNDTQQVNEYTIRLETDVPHWQEDWYRLDAISVNPQSAQRDGPPPGKKDRPLSPTEIRLHVPRDGRRELLIGFYVPKRPEARAGRYPFRVVIQTAVSGLGDGSRRRPAPRVLTGTAIVPPYYDWDMKLSPEHRTVRRSRRRADYELVVTSRSNDWLYCDLEMPVSEKEYRLDEFTERLAVPPPDIAESLKIERSDPNRMGSVSRSIPLRAATRLKALRGDPMEQKLPITARQVEAPSVAPLGSRLHGAVVEHASKAPPVTLTKGALVYIPRIPTKLADLPKQLFGSARQAMTFFLMLFLFVSLVTLLFHIYMVNFDNVRADVSGDGNSATLEFAGAHVPGIAVTLQTAEGQPVSDNSVASFSSIKPRKKDVAAYQSIAKNNNDVLNTYQVAFAHPLAPGVSYRLLVQDSLLSHLPLLSFTTRSSNKFSFGSVLNPTLQSDTLVAGTPLVIADVPQAQDVTGIAMNAGSDSRNVEANVSGSNQVTVQIPGDCKPSTYTIALQYRGTPAYAGSLGDLTVNAPVHHSGDTHHGGNGGDTHHGGNGGDTHHGGNGGDTHHGGNGGDTHHGGDNNGGTVVTISPYDAVLGGVLTTDEAQLNNPSNPMEFALAAYLHAKAGDPEAQAELNNVPDTGEAGVIKVIVQGMLAKQTAEQIDSAQQKLNTPSVLGDCILADLYHQVGDDDDDDKANAKLTDARGIAQKSNLNLEFAAVMLRQAALNKDIGTETDVKPTVNAAFKKDKEIGKLPIYQDLKRGT